ncbi:MAG TPA: preprotein translocase subunit SecG [Rhodothermales bacterium]|nr:preprotein translocase subunit SecG [Rhodothermales bacterium]
MFWFLIVLILIDALLLSLVVLLQSGKGGGLAGIASGGQAQQILGARQAPDFLEKATWTLGGLFIFLSLIASFFAGNAQTSVLQDRAGDVPAETTAPQAPPIGPAPTPGGTPGTGAPAAPVQASPTPAPAPATAPAEAPPAATE